MQAFFHHIGAPGNVDLGKTVTRRRSAGEVMSQLPADATAERTFFAENGPLRRVFPDGMFNCWGVPRGGERVFQQMEIGDLVLLVHSAGLYGRGIEQIGVVKALCPDAAWNASQTLWQWPDDRLFPFLFFFDTERGSRIWSDFKLDMGYDPGYQGGRIFQRIAEERLARWGGPSGYLSFLRNECGFSAI